MSTTHYAAAVVGCRIDKSEIFFKEEVRSCKCQTQEGPWSDAGGRKLYCPYCGKKMWQEVDKSIPQYVQDEKTLCGFTMFHNECDDFVVVAIEFTETNNYSNDSPEMLSASAANDIMRRKLKSVLGKWGLWDEKQFGIHVVMWCR